MMKVQPRWRRKNTAWSRDKYSWVIQVVPLRIVQFCAWFKSKKKLLWTDCKWCNEQWHEVSSGLHQAGAVDIGKVELGDGTKKQSEYSIVVDEKIFNAKKTRYISTFKNSKRWYHSEKKACLVQSYVAWNFFRKLATGRQP